MAENDDLTRLLHADRRAQPEHGAVHKPLHTSATFAYRTARELVAVFQGEQPGFVYARQGNPTGAALEAQLSVLEQARASTCFCTGMAAIAGTLLALLRTGDHIVSSQFLFGNTNSLFQTLQSLGVEVSLVDATDVAQVEQALRPQTKMVFVETIANPRTQVADLAGIGALCARRGVLYVVDSTMTTPVLLRPRTVGAALVVHSLTKGLSGQGNAMGGVVCDTGLFDWSSYANIMPAYKKGDPAGWGMLQIRKKGLRDMGATLRAEDAHRISSGIETLWLRQDAQCRTALALAQWLERQPRVRRVHYPGLASHAQHGRAAALFGGRFGTLLSFEPDPAVNHLDMLDRLKTIILSSHLSDTRTLAIPVAQTIYWEMGAQRRESMGIAEGLVRVSVGLEPLDDLSADLAQALG